ncbi:MAG: hypothetical protein H5U00_05465 [Clostridia bacterium]|nr:hypothetical protein [Clostridia bacterium]
MERDRNPAAPEEAWDEGYIDLRRYLRVVWRCRFLIVALTLISAVTAWLVSAFLVPAVFEAKTVLMVTRPAEQRQSQPPAGKGFRRKEVRKWKWLVNLPQPALDTARGTPVEALLEMAGRYPQMTLETCRAQVTNPVVLRNVIRQLGLDKHMVGLPP